jgi:HAD superfamily hydrolase (TIGR01509 family)
MKPDPRCWDWILARTGLQAGECLYVDDVAANCAAAEALGFRAVQYEIGAYDLLQVVERISNER